MSSRTTTIATWPAYGRRWRRRSASTSPSSPISQADSVVLTAAGVLPRRGRPPTRPPGRGAPRVSPAPRGNAPGWRHPGPRPRDRCRARRPRRRRRGRPDHRGRGRCGARSPPRANTSRTISGSTSGRARTTASAVARNWSNGGSTPVCAIPGASPCAPTRANESRRGPADSLPDPPGRLRAHVREGGEGRSLAHRMRCPGTRGTTYGPKEHHPLRAPSWSALLHRGCGRSAWEEWETIPRAAGGEFRGRQGERRETMGHG